MADLSITAGSVVAYGGANLREAPAGATIAAGDVIRIVNGAAQLATDANAAGAKAAGIALNGGATGQPINYMAAGDIDIGATVAVGKVYVLSTDGGIAPVDDVAGSEFVTIVGLGIAADKLRVNITYGGVAAAGAVS